MKSWLAASNSSGGLARCLRLLLYLFEAATCTEPDEGMTAEEPGTSVIGTLFLPFSRRLAALFAMFRVMIRPLSWFSVEGAASSERCLSSWPAGSLATELDSPGS